jgi:hypothetical protein
MTKVSSSGPTSQEAFGCTPIQGLEEIGRQIPCRAAGETGDQRPCQTVRSRQGRGGEARAQSGQKRAWRAHFTPGGELVARWYSVRSGDPPGAVGGRRRRCCRFTGLFEHAKLRLVGPRSHAYFDYIITHVYFDSLRQRKFLNTCHRTRGGVLNAPPPCPKNNYSLGLRRARTQRGNAPAILPVWSPRRRS